MPKILVPVDGSISSDYAIMHLIGLVKSTRKSMAVHLLNVQEPIDAWEMRGFKLAREIRRMQYERGAEQLRSAQALLHKANVKYEAEVVIGDVARTIVRIAKKRICSQIVMGTRGLGAVKSLLLGSITTKVIHFARIPVTVVKAVGQKISSRRHVRAKRRPRAHNAWAAEKLRHGRIL